jgi:hypothetical protein
MSVGSVAVQLQYGLYVVGHLSKWFTFFSVFSRLFVVVGSSFTLAANVKVFVKARILGLLCPKPAPQLNF